ncbi:GNAT family N-acetyltransferase [Culicoidibacter larvae]|uniref:GNAT family N-acetyltransferase n=1 Tax=Culicoidibacter larvae TaxID=2579976 RepID=A0A5R8QGV5_9FIRM|nr:GNAT family N-acetyltransferase [Culicoidibacter larvae]TLG77271.1 GNAT family N-acetyltransferase [Culicoidibacter larvae]
MIEYREATMADLDLLVRLRLGFLDLVADSGKATNELEQNIRNYFRKNLADENCVAILVTMDNALIATGTVFFYESVPSYDNNSGLNAYITSMFVEPVHTHQGIARSVLDRLIKKAKERGCGYVQLATTAQGQPLYTKYGFEKSDTFMSLKLK